MNKERKKRKKLILNWDKLKQLQLLVKVEKKKPDYKDDHNDDWGKRKLSKKKN